MKDSWKSVLKRSIKKTPIYEPMKNWLRLRAQMRDLKQWEQNGRPAPPPHLFKQRVLKRYAKEHRLRILVETGTLYGDMVHAMRNSFDKIYSIELSHELFLEAEKRFRSKNHIQILEGDSVRVLGDVMKELDQPALFWLDGHYSGGVTAKGEKDTPIYEELHHILEHQGAQHVVIIDDARCFGSESEYPTIEELTDFILSKRSHAEISVGDDIIRIVIKS
jgi:hypothetical protein